MRRPRRRRRWRRRWRRALQDRGLELTPAADRLNAYNAVQNTYLNTFQMLGALGLLLGSAGLGVVVLRNVLERRGELAVLLAVGFRPRALRRLVIWEHAALQALGLLLGMLAACLAVLPVLLSPGAQISFGPLAAAMGLVEHTCRPHDTKICATASRAAGRRGLALGLVSFAGGGGGGGALRARRVSGALERTPFWWPKARAAALAIQRQVLGTGRPCGRFPGGRR